MRWTPEMDAALYDALAQKVSGSQAAAILNEKFGTQLGRNAIISRAIRRGFKLLSKAQAARKRPPRETTAAPKRRKRRAPQNPEVCCDLLAPEPAPLRECDVMIPESQRVRYEDLRPDHCRWIMGDPCDPEHVYCGGVRLSGKTGAVRIPYCAAHAAIAYVAPRERRTQTAESNERRRFAALRRNQTPWGGVRDAAAV